MPDYKSSHLASYHELAVWGFVGRFIKSKITCWHECEIFYAQDLELATRMCYLRMRYHYKNSVKVTLVKSWQVGSKKLAGWRWKVGRLKLRKLAG